MIKLLIAFLVVVAVNHYGCDGEKTNCEQYSGKECSTCADHTDCYYCKTDKSCNPYELDHITTWFKNCTWGDARWKMCWLNVEALVISSCVVGGIVLISLMCCCCYCSQKCKERRVRKLEREVGEMEQRDVEREARQADRRAEREVTRDAIRQKYGITKTADTPYKKLNEDT